MKNNLNLYLALVVCGLITATTIEAQANKLQTLQRTNNLSSIEKETSISDSELFAQRYPQDNELDAFFDSKYNYCDVKLLSQYWGQSIVDTKARIGRKVLWGDGGIPYLEQYLVDVRMNAIRQTTENTYFSPCSYIEAGYTYDDAEALSQFWGESSIGDAKYRIEHNLLLGNQEEIEWALRQVNRR